MQLGGGQEQREVERESLAHTSWNLQASLCPGWQENLQRCKQSLGVQLAVSKLLRELRAGILQQAIPLCLSFCLSVLNSPSALIHSHIQFPALSIHQSPHFVSADFIGARSPSRCSHPEAAGEPPPAASPLPDLLTEGPSGGLSFSIARPAKTLILNLIPIVLLFTFSIEGNGSEEDTRREKRWGGKRWGDGGGGGRWIMERDVC